MGFRIDARYVLGTYLGHDATGTPSRRPDCARLHAALTHAAGSGSTAVLAGDDLAPSPQAQAALRWMENNPPSAIAIPNMRFTATGGATAYRDQGFFDKNDMKTKSARAYSNAVTVSGPFSWWWTMDVPDDVIDVLATLCEDIGCLGDNHASVIVELHSSADIDTETPERQMFFRESGSTDMPRPGWEGERIPTPGRGEELQRCYLENRPAKKKQPKDSASIRVEPTMHRITENCAVKTWYKPATASVSDAPWRSVIYLPTDVDVPVQERVGWCVAMHRAICSRLGNDAAPIVTGKYTDTALVPTNRVAIHFIDKETAPLVADSGVGFHVLVPHGMPLEEEAELLTALGRVGSVYRKGCRNIPLSAPQVVSAETFWVPPADGLHRVWQPVPALVPETRPMRGAKRSKPWALTDAAKLSVGHVFREQLRTLGHEATTRSELVDAVDRSGVHVVNARKINDSSWRRYVHRTPKHLTIEPYTATIDLADLALATSVVAVGQSRHMGGGLLLPVDLPKSAWQSMTGGATS